MSAGLTAQARRNFVMFFEGGTRKATRAEYCDARRRARKSASQSPLGVCRYTYPVAGYGWVHFIAYISQPWPADPADGDDLDEVKHAATLASIVAPIGPDTCSRCEPERMCWVHRALQGQAVSA